jgi:hypothetical protein
MVNGRGVPTQRIPQSESDRQELKRPDFVVRDNLNGMHPAAGAVALIRSVVGGREIAHAWPSLADIGCSN